MLWVPVLAHGLEIGAGDGLLAACAHSLQRAELVLAEGQAAVLEELAVLEGLLALGAHEALTVPMRPQQRQPTLVGPFAARSARH